MSEPERPAQAPNDSDVFAADVSMQVQIYRHLRAEILDGLWVDREGFMGERELADRFGVSVITSRAALERLAAEGLVVRGRGIRARAPYVATPPGAPALPLLDPPQSRDMTITLIQKGVDIAPAAACRAYDLSPGSDLWQCLRLRKFRGQPDVITHNAQRFEIGSRHKQGMLRSKPMLEILRAEGVEVDTVRRHFAVAPPPPLVARHLHVSIDHTLLVTFLTVHDKAGRIVDWVRAYWHPDRHEPEEVLDLSTGTWSALPGYSGTSP